MVIHIQLLANNMECHYLSAKKKEKKEGEEKVDCYLKSSQGTTKQCQRTAKQMTRNLHRTCSTQMRQNPQYWI